MTFDDAWVDEVRRGFKACTVFVWTPIFWLAYNQLNNNLVSQASTLRLDGVPNDIVAYLAPCCSKSLRHAVHALRTAPSLPCRRARVISQVQLRRSWLVAQPFGSAYHHDDRLEIQQGCKDGVRCQPLTSLSGSASPIPR